MPLAAPRLAEALRLKVGDRILVQYDDPDYWHERLVLSGVLIDNHGQECVVVATPDGDIYAEAFDDSEQWLARGIRGSLPPRLR